MVMWIKTVVTLFLALVFQLAQVLPPAAAIESCAVVGPGCACCDPADSCPCAGKDETHQKPAPLSSESSNTLKFPVARATGNRVSVESDPGIRPAATVAAPAITDQTSGYTGVRLSVAFCSFVI